MSDRVTKLSMLALLGLAAWLSYAWLGHRPGAGMTDEERAVLKYIGSGGVVEPVRVVGWGPHGDSPLGRLIRCVYLAKQGGAVVERDTLFLVTGDGSVLGVQDTPAGFGPPLRGGDGQGSVLTYR